MNKVPEHIAIIMDGNGRWAEERKLPRIAGHKAGSSSVKKIIKACLNHQVKVLSLFAFSLENRGRPSSEVEFLMNLLVTVLDNEVKELHQNNICLKVIGDRSYFSSKLSQLVINAEALTANNTGLVLVLAINYTGRWDITQAVNQLLSNAKAQAIDEISIEQFSQYLTLPDIKDPDLLIRTSGEQRISNFMLWQLAYTELYFTDIKWPDFDENAFTAALSWYATRQRRFGLIQDKES